MEPVGEAAPGRCAQFLASSSPPESMSRFGSGCSRLPRPPFLAEVDPPGTRCCKVREEGDPLETNLIGSPGQQERARSGHARRQGQGEKKKKRKNNNKPRVPQNYTGIHKSHPLDPPLKPDLNLATSPHPLFRPVFPRQMSPSTRCSQSQRC